MANTARNNAKTKATDIASSFNYRPGGLPQAANDNKKSGEELDEKGQVDRSNVIVGAFHKESKVPEEATRLGPAGDNIAGAVKRLLEKPTDTQDSVRENNKQEQDREVKNTDFPSEEIYEDYPEFESANDNYAGLAQAEEEGQEEEDEQQEEAKTKQKLKDNEPKFPYLVFILSLVEYFSILFLGIVAIFFTIVLPPIGMMIGIVIYVWKFFTSSVFLTWSYLSEKKFIKNYKRIFSRSKRLNNIIKSNNFSSVIAKRFFNWFPVLLPLVNFVYPTNLIIVLHTHRSKKKMHAKAKSAL